MLRNLKEVKRINQYKKYTRLPADLSGLQNISYGLVSLEVQIFVDLTFKYLKVSVRLKLCEERGEGRGEIGEKNVG